MVSFVIRGWRLFSSTAETIIPHTSVYDKYTKQITAQGGITTNRSLRLDEIIKKDKIVHLSAGSIAEIWNEYHLSKPYCSSLVITEATYSQWMGKRARESPSFVIPLRMASGGWLNYMVQHGRSLTVPMAIFTGLHDYQQWGENAPIRMVTHAFPDLAREKGVALTRSSFDGDSLNRQQAETLLKTTIDYYTGPAIGDGREDYGWVWQFNHDSTKFNFDSFISHHSIKHPLNP